MSETELLCLTAGQAVIYGGNRITHVSEALATAFDAGDRLIIVNDSGALLHVPADVQSIASEAVGRAHRAFLALGAVEDERIAAFFEAFARRLEDDASFAPIAAANRADVARAESRARSTTRLVLSDTMRASMITGLRGWAALPSPRGEVLETVEHAGWTLEQRVAGLGVVGFVFEGRPNVFADACGVLRSGNTVVFRIGSDALGTAEAIVQHALDPALEEAGLPAGAASLVASASRAAGYAMFDDPRLSLAVARGSGAAVAQLGAVARQAGTPVSLHGTGGAWMVAGAACDGARLEEVIFHSLDRKVCNTLNTVCVLRERADALVPRVLAGLDRAAERRETHGKLHVAERDRGAVPASRFERRVPIARSQGEVEEPWAETVSLDMLSKEHEWEGSPEITLVLVDSVGEAVSLFNTHSPRFVASLISDDRAEQDAFYDRIDAPFVGDGFTRWVDGQYALRRPELGLSNWQFGRLFGRGGVLSGDSVFTVRMRAKQTDPTVHR
ncbi:MAG: aldehyde dehydrogenase family protein [Sandaracinaceae bacterium]